MVAMVCFPLILTDFVRRCFIWKLNDGDWLESNIQSIAAVWSNKVVEIVQEDLEHHEKVQLLEAVNKGYFVFMVKEYWKLL